MSRSYITILAAAGSEEEQQSTIENLQHLDHDFQEHVECRIVEPCEGSIWKGYEKALQETDTKYVMMIRSGDTFLPDAPERAYHFFEKQGEALDAVMLRGSYEGRKSIPKKESVPTRGKVYSLERQEDVERIPNCYEGILLRTEEARKEIFRESHGYETFEEYIYRILDKKKKIGYVRQAVIMVNRPIKRSISRNKDNLNKEWYLGTVRDHLLPMQEFYRTKYGSLPLFFQYRTVYELKLRFESNRNAEDKHALNAGEREEFFDLCSRALQNVEDSLLIPKSRQVYGGDLSYALSRQFLDLKYKETSHSLYYPKAPEVYLDLVNYTDGCLVLDFAAPPLEEEAKRVVLWNGKKLTPESVVRYARTDYFGRTAYEEDTFRITLPCREMKKRNRLSLTEERNGQLEELPILTRRYTSRITREWKDSYWSFGKYAMRFGNKRNTILVERMSAAAHLVREAAALGRLALGGKIKREMFWKRLDYWRSWPMYHRQNIWLTFDKIYKGGDNGEYFYKYMMTRRDTDVVPAYLINEEAPDRKRLEEEGYQPLIFGSRKHRRMFLHAKMIFATHAGIYNFNGISEEELPYLQDLMNAEAICIQHGLSVQDLAFNANRAFNNNKRYYCASGYEVENLLQPIYGYDDPSVIRLTGVPRYDGLVNDDRRQILITPTWRSYIALPSEGKNNSRPYFDGFKETVYYKVYNDLISAPELLETARRTGYRILYLVHPNICEQARDFTQCEGVEIISALDVNYEKILTRSSLMVTDYSGVQFDFAYMRKPVVYYHTPKLPPHYEEGGFFYDTQGFGEICTGHQELVDTLCDYMERDCQLKPFYREREDDFFAFDDHNNCQRIFEDALEYQKKRQKEEE